MKAAGIVTQKYDKKKGLYKGDVIELSPERKVIAAVKDAVKEQSKDGETVCWAEEVTVDEEPHTSSAGEKFFGKYNNQNYNATGKVVIRTLDVKKDKLTPVKNFKFKIQFCDCLDEINQPDLKVDTFTLI